MVLHTGTKDGPVKAIDLLGIFGGFLAPLLVATYVIVGGLWLNSDRYDDERVAAEEISSALAESDVATLRANIDILEQSDRFGPVAAEMHEIVETPGGLSPADLDDMRELNDRVVDDVNYSHVHRMMSDMGDRHDALGIAFLVMNVAVGVCLMLFTFAVFRRVPVGRWVVLLLFVTAIMSATLGLTRCQQSCDLTGTRWRDDLPHDVAALGLLILIVVIPAVAGTDLPQSDRTGLNGDRNLRWLARLTRWLPQVALFPAAATLISLGFGRYTGLFQRMTWGVGYIFVIATSAVMFASRRGFARQRFDVSAIQENVLYGSAERRHGRFVLGRIKPDQRARFKHDLRSALDERMIRAETPRPRTGLVDYRSFTVTFGVTASGLRELELPYRWVAPGPDAFGAGMRERLGDFRQPEEFSSWEHDPDVLIWITGASPGEVDGQVKHVIRHFRKSLWLRRLPDCSVDLDNRVLKFADGLSNPWIVDVHRDDDVDRQGGGKLTSDRKWEQLALGEFILGEVDETRDVFPVPEPTAVFEGGTFLVLRQLEVDTDAFEKLIDAGLGEVSKARGFDLTGRPPSRELVAAKMMGRDRQGASLASSLDGASGWGNNTFSYADDPEGFRCPLGSHVRRANPRDSLGFDGVPAFRRRIIRRGMPYSKKGRDARSGLMFAAFNARIADQFEFIQQQWLDDGDAFRVGGTPDPIAGRGDRRTRHYTWHTPDGPRRIELGDKPVTTAVGGEYFLVPSMAGLAALAKA